MLIKKKENNLYFYFGVIGFLAGFLLLFYLMSVKGSSGDFFTVFGKLFSIGLIIFGIVYFKRYEKFKQFKDVNIDIKRNEFIVEDKKYLLDNSYLTTSFTKSDNLFCVSLWIEKDNKTVEVFKNFVLDLDEMANFLSMIKPYRKSNILLAKNESGKIKLFDGGFAFENREFFYEEIEKFDTELVITDSAYYLDIKILFKNSQMLEQRLNGGIKEYAKAMYAFLVFDSKNFSKYSLEDYLALFCPKKSYWGIIIFVLDIITAGLIFYNEKFFALGAVMLFVTAFYPWFDNDFKRKLCKEIMKIYLQIHYDKDLNENNTKS